MNIYDTGDVVEVQAVFTNTAGTAVTPTTVLFRVLTPDGSSTTYTSGSSSEVTNPSTGTYLLTLASVTEGVWRYRVEGTGTNKAAEESGFEIRASYFS